MKSEIGSILRLNGWIGRIVLVVYAVGTTIVAVLNLDKMIQPAFGVLALALFWAGIALLAIPQGEPHELRWTIAIVVIVVLTTAISSWNILDPANSGYATWPLGAMTFLLFVLALRGRRGYAWIGFAALAVVSVLVALIADQELVRVINDVARQSATLLIGTLFGIVLRRATQTITAIQGNQVTRVSVAASSAVATRERADQSSRLEQQARPALERIIANVPLSEQDFRHFAVLESTLRDGIQATGFSSERITDATRGARLRGLSVTLIDDRGTDLSTAERLRVESAFLQVLAETGVGTVTARLSPVGREEIATIIVDEGGHYRRVLVTPYSVEVTQL